MSIKAELIKLLEKLPDVSMRGRKVYSAMELAYRIREACNTYKIYSSSEEMIQNVLLIGKRLRYMSYEFTDEEYKNIVKEAFRVILLDYTTSKRQKEVIQNLKDAFEETEEFISNWKSIAVPDEPSQEPLSKRKHEELQ